MVPLCRSEGVAIMPWSPLARGVLTRPAGKAGTKRIDSDQYTPTLYGAAHDRAILEAVAKAADKLGPLDGAGGPCMASVAAGRYRADHRRNQARRSSTKPSRQRRSIARSRGSGRASRNPTGRAAKPASSDAGQARATAIDRPSATAATTTTANNPVTGRDRFAQKKRRSRRASRTPAAAGSGRPSPRRPAPCPCSRRRSPGTG